MTSQIEQPDVDPVAELVAKIRAAGHVVTFTGTVTSKTCAAVLDISENTLRHWRARGVGPRFMKGHSGTVRYAICDIASYLELSMVDL